MHKKGGFPLSFNKTLSRGTATLHIFFLLSEKKPLLCGGLFFCKHILKKRAGFSTVAETEPERSGGLLQMRQGAGAAKTHRGGDGFLQACTYTSNKYFYVKIKPHFSKQK